MGSLPFQLIWTPVCAEQSDWKAVPSSEVCFSTHDEIRHQVLRAVWKECVRNISVASKGLQKRLLFMVTVWEVTQNVQAGPEGGRRRTLTGHPTTVRTDENEYRLCEVLRSDR